MDKNTLSGRIGIVLTLLVMCGSIGGVAVYGVSSVAFGVFFVGATIGMLSAEIGYHRYFAHRSFRTSRTFQFVLAWLAMLTPMRGPIFWAATHREHHRIADTKEDLHAPTHSILNAGIGFIFDPKIIAREYTSARELLQYPEIVWLDRYFGIPLVLGLVLAYALGAWLERVAPGLGTSGPQMLVWGGLLRTLYPAHMMGAVNIFGHHPFWHFGYRTFPIRDASRNVHFIGYLGAGLGWHNNHHGGASYARNGIFWWELDASAWVIKQLERLGIVWNVRWHPPSFIEKAKAYRERRKTDPHFSDPCDRGLPPPLTQHSEGTPQDVS